MIHLHSKDDQLGLAIARSLNLKDKTGKRTNFVKKKTGGGTS